MDTIRSVTPAELNEIANIASNAYYISVDNAHQISSVQDTYSTVDSFLTQYKELLPMPSDILKFIELLELMYSILGVPIRDFDGSLRDVADVSHDLRSLNPKILLSFQELMQF